MTLILLITCLSTPYIISFTKVSSQTSALNIFENIIDILFLIDIIIIMNSVYYDNDYNLVDDRKMIALTYLKGWFLIDIMAILPFDMIISASSKNVKMVRIARIGRFYKLIKLTRLLRVLKLVK